MRSDLPIAIIDIDGTLCDLTHRLHYIQKEPKDWESFHADLMADKPITQMINLVNRMYQDYQIILCTGRMERTRVQTILWMSNYGVCFDHMYMRTDDDHRLDTIIKPEMFTSEELAQAVIAIDDRARTIKMWRELGLIGLLCSEGNF